MIFYPQGPAPDNSVDVQSDVLTATTDGKHILGATIADSNIDLSDIGVTLPQLSCLPRQTKTILWLPATPSHPWCSTTR